MADFPMTIFIFMKLLKLPPPFLLSSKTKSAVISLCVQQSPPLGRIALYGFTSLKRMVFEMSYPFANEWETGVIGICTTNGLGWYKPFYGLFSREQGCLLILRPEGVRVIQQISLINKLLVDQMS
jgi:hypothetical protein